MIETPFEIRVPPGMYLNGDEADKEGRWASGFGVRFLGEDGIPQAIGGTSSVTLSGDTISGTPRAAWAYKPSGGSSRLVFLATTTKLFTIEPFTGVVNDITPVGFNGNANGTYAFANMGDTVYITDGAEITDGKMWRWHPSLGTGPAEEVLEFTAEHGQTARGVIVTPDSFLIAIMGDRDVAWASQGGHTDWTASSTDSAGDLRIRTRGRLMRLMQLGSETMILSSEDLWAMDYIAGDLIYGVRPAGESCGIIGPNAAAAVQTTAYWMGTNSFYTYDGYVRPLACDIHDYVFNDMNREVGHKFFTVKREAFKEIWFHYASNLATNTDRAAIYNYENNTWTRVIDLRTAGTHGELRPGIDVQNSVNSPMMFFNATASIDDITGSSWSGASLTTGRIKLSESGRVVSVNRFIPGGATATNDVYLHPAMDLAGRTFASPVVIPDASVEDELRFKARWIKFQHFFDDPDSRVGRPVLGVVEGSRR